MAQRTADGYELYGVFHAASIGSKPYKGQADSPDPDGLRSITLVEKPGTDDDPYGGVKQVDSIHDVDISNVPDGATLEPADHPAYGYDDDRRVAIYIKGSEKAGSEGTVTVAWHGTEDL